MLPDTASHEPTTSTRRATAHQARQVRALLQEIDGFRFTALALASDKHDIWSLLASPTPSTKSTGVNIERVTANLLVVVDACIDASNESGHPVGPSPADPVFFMASQKLSAKASTWIHSWIGVPYRTSRRSHEHQPRLTGLTTKIDALAPLFATGGKDQTKKRVKKTLRPVRRNQSGSSSPSLFASPVRHHDVRGDRRYKEQMDEQKDIVKKLQDSGERYRAKIRELRKRAKAAERALVKKEERLARMKLKLSMKDRSWQTVEQVIGDTLRLSGTSTPTTADIQRYIVETHLGTGPEDEFG
ncbi:Uu.00g120770.m01.CDS01 [Anthostomella pinea]|uniref:Uu.00g120770.m01.CDS01 n=1 Tax=Anthostomella pinea TaxID=933095 RepID=A0AAI8VGX1_9PEZI|nr:Uu.00g120770.m01.CDS01 [Anthostomella pinea]